MIRAERISKSFQDAGKRIELLSELSFTIAAGQTIALMGQSGAGKSTLLHLIGGFERLDSGEIYLADRPISQLSDREISVLRRQHLGMVFQQFNLIPSLSARDNISFVRRLKGMPAEDDYSRQLIEVFRLQQRLDHYPAQLSGGEQQRVAIARALAARPSLLLADEPTGNLDEHTAQQVMQQLMDAVALNSSTLLLVTHSRRTASYLSETWHLQNAELEQGAILQEDAPC